MRTTTIHELWTRKVEQLSIKVKSIASGDDDLYHEGLIGIKDGLTKDPDATDSYLLQAARYAMSNSRKTGKSVDNGVKNPITKRLVDGTLKTYKKDMIRVYDYTLIDHTLPPDILALDRICADEFYESLDSEEAQLVNACIQTLDGRYSDCRARTMLDMDREEFIRTKRSAYAKFVRAFGSDEDLQ